MALSNSPARRFSLRAKILLAIVPLITGPAAVLGWLAFLELKDDARVRVSLQVEALLNQAQHIAEHEAELAQGNAAVIARSDLVERYLLTENELDRYMIMQPPLLRTLRDFKATFPQHSDIWILLADGREDAHVGGKETGLPPDLFQGLAERLAEGSENSISRLDIAPRSNRLRVICASRVALVDRAVEGLGARPQTRGFVAIATTLADTPHLPRRLESGGLGNFFYVDNQGQIVAHPDASRIGQRLDAWPATLPEVEPPFRETVELVSESGEMVRVRALADGIFAVVAVPRGTLVAAGQRIGLMVAASTLLAVLLSAGALLLMLERLVVSPLSRLGAAARRIGTGGPLQSIDVGGSLEMEALADTFRTMERDLNEAAEQARRLAYHDQLTGLPNRTMLLKHLGSAIATARRHDQRLAVVFLDLDNFKQVNDTLGHAQGDRLLVEFSGILRQCLRDEDVVARSGIDATGQVVARLGGDEFTILLTSIHDALDAGQVAERLLSALENPITVGEHQHHLGASIGITLFPDDGLDAATLLKNADLAMYQAKEIGKNNFQYFSREMNAKVAHRMTMEHRLRNAIEDKGLDVEYQPIVDGRSGQLVGVEALVRWKDSLIGSVPAGELVEVAEHSGLILRVGDWVLRRACRDTKRLESFAGPNFYTSVNVSGIQLNRGNFAQTMSQALAAADLAPGRIQIEVAESEIINFTAETRQELAALASLGVKVLLDNFGTGYSSLGQLRTLPIHGIKIDRGFVAPIGHPGQDHPIVAALVGLAQGLGLQVIAEGIETAEQRDFLLQQGCHLMQGWLFGQATGWEQMALALATRRRA